MIIRALILALLIAGIDQASKWFVLLEVMNPPQVIEVTSFFDLVLAYNTGVSFGLFGSDSEWRPFILAGVAIAIVVALFVWLYKEPGKLIAVSVGLISGGAIGNVIDRFIHIGVVDFLSFSISFLPWRIFNPWPAFNLADSFIFIGVLVLLYDGLFSTPSKGNK
ncbi:signal peptidase II [Kiloniella litopenaei]|uniref:Lipoprotein signal peptidase n=1 Tax=Kiloniella litopenaei TaxID=1549748 RepID=A0A0M2R7E4_9PROT|nr:signal peptidase II [Kiloniella litopenaei]KKJ77802.1 signal peptidase II [Kiloniella litopenaei]